MILGNSTLQLEYVGESPVNRNYHDLQYQMRRLNRVGPVRLPVPYSSPISSHFSLLTGQFQYFGSYDTRIATTGRAYSLSRAL